MGQPRPNPLLAEARSQARLLDQLVRALALPLPSEDVGRRRSPSAREAANVRWIRERGGESWLGVGRISGSRCRSGWRGWSSRSGRPLAADSVAGVRVVEGGDVRVGGCSSRLGTRRSRGDVPAGCLDEAAARGGGCAMTTDEHGWHESLIAEAIDYLGRATGTGCVDEYGAALAALRSCPAASGVPLPMMTTRIRRSGGRRRRAAGCGVTIIGGISRRRSGFGHSGRWTPKIRSGAPGTRSPSRRGCQSRCDTLRPWRISSGPDGADA